MSFLFYWNAALEWRPVDWSQLEMELFLLPGRCPDAPSGAKCSQALRGSRASIQLKQLLSLVCAGTGWKFPGSAVAQQLELPDTNSVLSFHKKMGNCSSDGNVMFRYVYLITSPLNLICMIISSNLLYCFCTWVQGFNVETVCRRVFFCVRVKISEVF